MMKDVDKIAQVSVASNRNMYSPWSREQRACTVRLIGENINCSLNQPIDKVVTSIQYILLKCLWICPHWTVDTWAWVNSNNFRPHLLVLFSIKMYTQTSEWMSHFQVEFIAFPDTKRLCIQWNNVKGFSFQRPNKHWQ